MPDEATEAPAVETEDTPAPTEPEAPTADTPEAEAPDTNWQERYENLHPEYTRATQEAAQLRQIVDAARKGDPEALEFLGYEVPEDETDGELTEDEALRKEIEDLKEWKAEQASRDEEQQQQAELNDFRDTELQRLDKVAGRRFNEREVQILVAYADAYPNKDGNPDFDAAYEALVEYSKESRKELLKSKRAPKPPSGAQGESKIDTSTPEGRRAAVLATAEAAQTDSE